MDEGAAVLAEREACAALLEERAAYLTSRADELERERQYGSQPRLPVERLISLRRNIASELTSLAIKIRRRGHGFGR